MLPKKAESAIRCAKKHPFRAVTGAIIAVGGTCSTIGAGMTAANILATIGAGVGTIKGSCLGCIQNQHSLKNDAKSSGHELVYSSELVGKENPRNFVIGLLERQCRR